MQDDAVEIKSNMMASGKLKARVETGNRKTKRFREQEGPSGSNRSSDDRVDDMARVIKELSNKISRMELEQARADSYPKKYFKRNQNPPNQQRQIKKEDQKIQAPLKNENFIGANDFQDFKDSDDEVLKIVSPYKIFILQGSLYFLIFLFDWSLLIGRVLNFFEIFFGVRVRLGLFKFHPGYFV